jgi:hypothetical protein
MGYLTPPTVPVGLLMVLQEPVVDTWVVMTLRTSTLMMEAEAVLKTLDCNSMQ